MAFRFSLFILISIYIYRSLSLLRLSSGRFLLPRLHKTSITPLYASDIDHDDNAESLIEYGGLESSLENMETGVAIEELGLLVCVGPSLVGITIHPFLDCSSFPLPLFVIIHLFSIIGS